MDLSGDQDCSTTERRRPSSLAHPISFHSLNQFHCSQSHLLSIDLIELSIFVFLFRSKVKGLAISVNVDGRVNQRKLALQIEEPKELEETLGKLEKIHVHFVRKIDQ